MQNNGMIQPDSSSRLNEQGLAHRSKPKSTPYQNQANSNAQKRMDNESGEDAFPDPYAFASNHEAVLEERTQLEVENTAAISITWFIKKLQKIQKTNKSLDGSKVYEIDQALMKQLLPISDCNDDLIMATELDYENQRTIKVDAARTRVGEMKGLHSLSVQRKKQVFNLDEVTLRTEKALTFY